MNEKNKGLNSMINVASSILAAILFSIGHFYGMVFNVLGFLVLLFPILSFLKYLKNSKGEKAAGGDKHKEPMEEYESRIRKIFFEKIFPFFTPLFLFVVLITDSARTAHRMAAVYTLLAIYWFISPSLLVREKKITSLVAKLAGGFIAMFFIVVFFSQIFFVSNKQDPASEDSEVSISWRKDSLDFKHSFPKQTPDGSK